MTLEHLDSVQGGEGTRYRYQVVGASFRALYVVLTLTTLYYSLMLYIDLFYTMGLWYAVATFVRDAPKLDELNHASFDSGWTIVVSAPALAIS